jgi:hypothetical protein
LLLFKIKIVAANLVAETAAIGARLTVCRMRESYYHQSLKQVAANFNNKGSDDQPRRCPCCYSSSCDGKTLESFLFFPSDEEARPRDQSKSKRV